MNRIAHAIWIIPALPLLAAAISAVLSRRHRSLAAGLAIGSMAIAFVLSLVAFQAVGTHGTRIVENFTWFELGDATFQLGFVLDPLAAIMLVMVTFVGLLIFIYSVGYMAHDENFARFFCFLSLFAAAMLGVVVANNLLLLFMCWELVGLASYLLIGFWYHKPSAAAAAKKAFITTRIGDIGFLLGMVWLYTETGTLLFYDNGNGCLEASALTRMVTHVTSIGMVASTAIGLLIFCGAVGKSGQLPLHVWLPDAMEGPTPVSALIHAATMVAAGVFLVARVFPLMGAGFEGDAPASTALQVVTWVGALTAVFAASIAVAQNDIKRILAYSTVSQLGYMFLGLGVGGIAVGMFHLITHAFFKALLFLGAGSVIHGSHDEQDIRRMGGLRKYMPITFATYAIGMLALAGFPLFFSGFWSKDEILHSAQHWPVSKIPFYLGLAGALLTAFYMTRQVALVFFGTSRAQSASNAHSSTKASVHAGDHHDAKPHESPAVMTVPLVLLAVFAVLLSVIGTPAWPWFHGFMTGHHADSNFGKLFESGFLLLILTSAVVVFAGIGFGWWLYGRRAPKHADDPDALESFLPGIYPALRNKLYVDEFYEATIIRFNAWSAWVSDWFDRIIWNGVVQTVSYLFLAAAWVSRFIDEYVVNLGFDFFCSRVSGSGGKLSKLQTGQAQTYLRVIGLALTALVLFLTWGGSK